MRRSEPITGADEYTFTAEFEPAEEGGYVVRFPSLPALVTEGETLEEAREMAADLLTGYLELLRERGKPLPASDAPGGNVPTREPLTVRLRTA
jgi:antitoxin HicB